MPSLNISLQTLNHPTFRPNFGSLTGFMPIPIFDASNVEYIYGITDQLVRRPTYHVASGPFNKYFALGKCHSYSMTMNDCWGIHSP